MKILYVYYNTFDPSNANGTQIINTTNSLSSRGHDITIIAAGDLVNYAAQNNMEIRAEVSRVPIRSENAYLGRLAYYTFVMSKLRGADLIFTRDIWFLKFIEFVPNVLLKPVLYEAHQCYSGRDHISPADERGRLRQADRVISQSEGVAADIASLGIPVSQVIRNAAPEQNVPSKDQSELRTKFGIDPDTTVIVYAGSFNAWKNDLELLVDSVAKLAENDVDCMLLIVGGSAAEVSELEQYSEEALPDTFQTKLTGRVPHKEVFKYLKAADIGVVPLKKGHKEAEEYTSPIKLFEYLVSDLVVVASGVPAIERGFEDHESVYTYEPGNKHSLATTLDTCVGTETQLTDRPTYKKRAKLLEAELEELMS